MNYVDNNGEQPCSIISMAFSPQAHVWESANIAVKTEGNNWRVFYNKDKEELNMHHLAKNRPVRPVSYRFRGYRPTPPPAPQNPLITPPVDNYTDFRVRRRIYANRPRPQSTREIPEFLMHPKDESTRYFHGDNPKRNPFRISSILINERRIQEAKLSRPSPQVPKSARSIRSNYMELYQKSLKPKRESVWPPDIDDEGDDTH